MSAAKVKRVKAMKVALGLTDNWETVQWVLPCDAASYDRMFEQIAMTLATRNHGTHTMGSWNIAEQYKPAARAVLAAIGIKKPHQKSP